MEDDMDIKIINNCMKSYKPNPEKVIKRILSKVPSKYIDGIRYVDIYDDKSDSPLETHFKPTADGVSLHVNMKNSDFSGTPFFSIMMLNLSIIWAINDSYGKKTMTNYSQHNIRVGWLSLGIWTPFVYIIIIVGRLIRMPFAKPKKT